MSSDVQIVASHPRYLESFRSVLDTVARERPFLVLVEAPSSRHIQQFVSAISILHGQQGAVVLRSAP